MPTGLAPGIITKILIYFPNSFSKIGLKLTEIWCQPIAKSGLTMIALIWDPSPPKHISTANISWVYLVDAIAQILTEMYFIPFKSVETTPNFDTL